MNTNANKMIYRIGLIILILTVTVFLTIKLLNKNNESPVSSFSSVPIDEQLERLYDSYTVLDAVKCEVDDNGNMIQTHFMPDDTQQKAVIGPNPETQADRTLMLLDEQVWLLSKKSGLHPWYQPTALELENKTFGDDILYSAIFRFYDAGYTDDQKPYYAVEVTVQAVDEKAQPIVRHIFDIQPEGNTEDLPYNAIYIQSHNKAESFRDIRYFSYPEEKPENVNVKITFNLHCYTGFPWDLRDGYEKTDAFPLDEITLG